MNLLPFGKLDAAKPRSFVPAELNLGDWPQIAPLFDQLEARAARAGSAAELEKWLLDWSELSAALDEESSRRYIAMTCHTDNPEAEKAYLDFLENIEPHLKPRQFALEKIYVTHPQRGKLPASRFHVFDRDVKNHVELFRPENVALETEEVSNSPIRSAAHSSPRVAVAVSISALKLNVPELALPRSSLFISRASAPNL